MGRGCARQREGSARLAESSNVTLLCTANLAGDLDLLARLGTLLARERSRADGPVCVLDLGGSCADEAWICRATGGRAVLIVLDAMGYDLALVGGPDEPGLSPGELASLRGTVSMALLPWAATLPVRKGRIAFGVTAGAENVPAEMPALAIAPRVPVLPQRGDTTITIGEIAKGTVLRLTMAWPDWIVIEAERLDVPPTLPPDPVLSATIAFVVDEARAFAQRQGRTP